MSKTVIKCCNGTEVDVSKMTVEQAVAKLKELASTTTCPCHLESEHGADVTMLSLTVNPTKTGLYYELAKSDIGKFAIRMFGSAWPVSGFIGRVLPMDVGKRVYLVRPDEPGGRSIVQVENDEQFRRRTGPAKYLGWRVGKPRRRPDADEWEVPVYDAKGKRDEGKTYYTTDKEDALNTYRAMLKEMGLEGSEVPTDADMMAQGFKYKLVYDNPSIGTKYAKTDAERDAITDQYEGERFGHHTLGKEKEMLGRLGLRPASKGKITWKYNRYGHVEVWNGDEDEEEADLYIQGEEDVNEFFRKMGLDPETIGPDDWDTAEDPGYFDK